MGAHLYVMRATSAVGAEACCVEWEGAASAATIRWTCGRSCTAESAFYHVRFALKIGPCGGSLMATVNSGSKGVESYEYKQVTFNF